MSWNIQFPVVVLRHHHRFAWVTALTELRSKMAWGPGRPIDHQIFGDYGYQWIGLRENLQETMVFTIKYGVFL